MRFIELAVRLQLLTTPLAGHTTALGYANNPSEKSAREKLARDGHVSVDDLVPGLALVLDFSENMNNILAIHRGFRPSISVLFAADLCEHAAEDLDAVVQPGISYDALNAELRERNIPLFFPVDPAPYVRLRGACSSLSVNPSLMGSSPLPSS